MNIKPDHILLLNELSEKEFLVIAFETVKQLGWRIKFVSDAGVIAYTENGAFSWNGEITVKLTNELAEVSCLSISNVVADEVHRKKAVAKYVATFESMRALFTADEINELYKNYKKDFLPAYEDTLKPDTRPSFNFSNGFWSYFRPTKNYFITPFLVCLNILIYLILVGVGVPIMDPEAKDLLPWGANATLVTLDGQWWRLLSNCFLHFGLIHLILNMYALVYVGFLLEPFFSKLKFLVAYILAGIVASLVSIWWHDNIASAGASGAIFGLYGVFLAILSTNHVEKSMRKGFMAAIGIFVVYNLVYGSFSKGIDNAAHIGGLLAGVVIGFCYVPGLKKPNDKKLNALLLGLTVILMLAFSAVAYTTLAKSDRVVYFKKMEEFYKLEKKALLPFRTEQSLTMEQTLESLTKGIGYWKNGLTLINESDQLDLSQRLHQRNKWLIKYCQLRIRSYELMYNDNFQNASPSNAEQEQLVKEIKNTLSRLSSR